MVPVLLLFAIALPRLRTSVHTLALLGVLALTVMTNWGAARATAPAALQNSEAAQAWQLLDALAEVEQPYRDVFVPSSGLAEICRMWDTAHRYVAYDPDGPRLIAYDTYMTDRDVLGHSGPYVYIVAAGKAPAGSAGELGELVPGYTFWYGDKDQTDSVSGFPGGDAMMDYPDSPDYTARGEIDAEHRLHAVGLPNGEWVLHSAELVLHTVADITVDYQLDDPAAGPMVLQLWQDGSCLAQFDMDGSSPTFSLSGTAPGTYTVRLVLPEGAGATVSSFLFTPSGR